MAMAISYNWLFLWDEIHSMNGVSSVLITYNWLFLWDEIHSTLMGLVQYKHHWYDSGLNCTVKALYQF